jgi:hypothetical protein
VRVLSLRRLLSPLVLLLVLAPLSRAQDSSARTRDLDPLGRLDPSTRYTVEVILDSARLAGLPTGPIESKALEGITKRADGRLIRLAVRGMLQKLRDARTALGPSATTDELKAGAGALSVGITAAELAQLARTRHDKSLTYPLVVLADLVTRGVPRDTAAQTIFQLWQRGAADEDFLGLFRGVERDIVSGTDPGVALLNRAREIPSRGPPPAAPPSSARPDNSETQNK